jgi:hypothetical protein
MKKKNEGEELNILYHFSLQKKHSKEKKKKVH